MMNRFKPSLAQNQAASQSNALIQMRSVVKTFRTAAGEINVLKGIDLNIQQGEFISIVGRSGSGKSTLLNMLTGIDHPTQGKVCAAGTYLHTLSESQLAAWRGRNMGIVFQFFQLLPMLTLAENVMLPMDFCDIYPAAEREQRALQLLERVGLQRFAHKLPGAVSGGQQQSAAVARALATDPPILVADEPTGNLDSRTAEQVMQLFEELSGQGKTIVMVTHDSTLAQRTQRSMIISDGELISPWIADAFPKASHSTLLRLMHLATPTTLPPGSLLPGHNQLWIITQGEVVSTSDGKPDQHFLPGQMIDLSTAQPGSQEFRAGPSIPLSALVLNQDETQRIIEASAQKGVRP